MFQPLNAKVESPNYHFDTDSLFDFFPGKNLSVLETKLGKGEILSEESGLQTIRYYVSEPKYKFPVIVHARDGVIEDFLARLPSYFLHDIFFQSLVNNYGKQKIYKRFNEEAFYVWEQENFKHVYSAACTITCFPIFYSVEKIGTSEKSILQKMKNAARSR